jgi:ABC-type nitrate/sulfonate/bicarbonate transport system permease component
VKKLFLQYQRIYYGVFAIIGLLVLWQIASFFGTLPPTLEVIAYFGRSFFEPIGRYTMIGHIGASLSRVGVGYSLASVAGIIFGISMGRSKLFEALFKPVFEIIRPIPPVAWIPIAILWFGIGEGPKYFIIFIGAFVTVTVNAYDGATRVDEVLMGAARMLGATERQLFSKIVLPSCIPPIFAGLQVALSGSWMAVLAAELIRSEKGCGWIITAGMQMSDIKQIMVGMIAIALVGLFLITTMRKIEENVLKWNYRSR